MFLFFYFWVGTTCQLDQSLELRFNDLDCTSDHIPHCGFLESWHYLESPLLGANTENANPGTNKLRTTQMFRVGFNGSGIPGCLEFSLHLHNIGHSTISHT